MKKLLESLGLADPDPPVLERVHVRDHFSDIDMDSFAKWCEELNVSSMARGSEFTVIIGNHVKHVTLDRF